MKKMPSLRYLSPFLLFCLMIAFFEIGLYKNPSHLPSTLIGRSIPKMVFTTLNQPSQRYSEKKLIGQISLLNVWASWCSACQIEHPILIDISQSKKVKIYSLNYKDQRSNALAYLQKWGNPYVMTIYDPSGSIAINWGVYGTPETFLIDQQGVVRERYVGPITLSLWENTILPKIEQLRRMHS